MSSSSVTPMMDIMQELSEACIGKSLDVDMRDLQPLEDFLNSMSKRELIQLMVCALDFERIGAEHKAEVGLLRRRADGDTERALRLAGDLIDTADTRRAVMAALSRHNKVGGSRDKRNQIRAAWATGKYSSRDICAEQECGALGISFSTARKHLRNTPNP